MCVLSYGLLAQLPPNPWQMLRDSQRKTLLCFCARSGPTWLHPSWLFGSTAPIELHYLGVSMALASQTTPTSHCKNKQNPSALPVSSPIHGVVSLESIWDGGGTVSKWQLSSIPLQHGIGRSVCGVSLPHVNLKGTIWVIEIDGTVCGARYYSTWGWQN